MNTPEHTAHGLVYPPSQTRAATNKEYNNLLSGRVGVFGRLRINPKSTSGCGAGFGILGKGIIRINVAGQDFCSYGSELYSTGLFVN